MLPILARTLFALQERMLGRASFRILRELNRSQHWSREKLRELQLQRLREVVRLAGEHTPFWRERFARADLKADGIQDLDDLRKLPLLDKETIRAHREEMVWREEGPRVKLVRTSGSTNEALEFYTSSTREAHINAARMRGHEWVGIRRGEKELYYWGSPIELSKQDRIKRMRDWLINDGFTNGFEVTPDRVERYFQQWKRFRPKCIFGYPSTIALTVTMAEQRGIDLSELKPLGLEAIITTSEVLGAYREIIEEGFGVPVYDSYGLREAGLIGHECGHRTMHVMDEQLILETLDPDTLEPTDGEGELVVTNLVGTAFPVLRYRTGDIVRLSEEPCQCGLTLSRVEISGGRAVDFIVTTDEKWLAGYSLIYALRSVKGITKCQAHQERVGEVRVRVVTDENYPADGDEKVIASMAGRMRDDSDITVEHVDDIRPARSGKYRPVIGNVARQRWEARAQPEEEDQLGG